MIIFKEKKDLIQSLENDYSRKEQTGLVPTMGALHEGHLELICRALKDNDKVVCSIFVNPAQFDHPEDLSRYPRTLEADLEKLEKAGCHIVYNPDVSDLYTDPLNLKTTLQFGEIESILEGKYRPGHFKGVGLVVAKLFNIVRPHTTYFGQKDLQQFYIIRQLIDDLSYPIKLMQVPTVREPDGLAMSSRNKRIDPRSRPEAGKLYASLTEARKKLKSGERPEEVKAFVRDFIGQYAHLELEYFEMVDRKDFSITRTMDQGKSIALCIAGYIDNIRLIDNVMYN